MSILFFKCNKFLQVYWAREVEACFLQAVEPELTKFLKKNVDQLEELSVLVRGDLHALQRKILTALITIDVHARDIVDNLLRCFHLISAKT